MIPKYSIKENKPLFDLFKKNAIVFHKKKYVRVRPRRVRSIEARER